LERVSDDAEIVLVDGAQRLAILEQRRVTRLLEIAQDELHPVQRAILYGDAT
jgi:hypothetical protein